MSVTVSFALKKYWQEHVAYKVVAKSRIDYAIRNLDDFFGDRKVRNIDVQACREYQTHRTEEDVGDSTIRYELGILQAAANHCLKWRHITVSELPSIELPDSTPHRQIWLYKDELQTLAASATGRALNFILLAYYTAGRKTSVETLERYQVTFDPKPRINLAKRGEAKTKKHRPIVPIDPAVVDRVKNLLESHTSKFVLGDGSDIRPEFNKAVEKAGLLNLPERGLREAGRLTPHILRHSRATHLLQDGVNPFAVANLLGDNLQTVLKIYGHACPDYLEEAMASGF